MRSMFKRNLQTSGKVFGNQRTSSYTKGIQSSDNQGTLIAFSNDYDIHSGDWITTPARERLFITHVDPILDYKNCYYITEYEYNKSQQATPSFNIQAEKIENSIIGTQLNATISLNTELQKMKTDVENSTSMDKEELLKLISLLEDLKNNQEPVPKGFLAKFSSVMERNSWITGSISSYLLSLFLHP